MAITAEQGTTVRIPATYRNAAGSLVDPVSPSVELRNPSNVVALTAVPTREDIGEFYYDWAVPPNAFVGLWVARFSGTIDGLLVFGDEPVVVVEPGFVAGDLISLSEFKISQGIDPLDTRDDARNAQWIHFVSDAIRAYTERDFGLPVVTEERSFEYDGSGYLDIDDASNVTDVVFTYPLAADVIIPSTDWTAKPQRRDDAPIYYYILMAGYYGLNPEMGFTRNLDVWVSEHGFRWPSIIKVTGTWGWSYIPGAVKMAAMLTMQEWIERPSGEGLTSEAIEGWSRSWGGKGNSATAAIAIPQRARDLLATFDKGI